MYTFRKIAWLLTVLTIVCFAYVAWLAYMQIIDVGFTLITIFLGGFAIALWRSSAMARCTKMR
jgi:hypothetical protein